MLLGIGNVAGCHEVQLVLLRAHHQPGLLLHSQKPAPAAVTQASTSYTCCNTSVSACALSSVPAAACMAEEVYALAACAWNHAAAAVAPVAAVQMVPHDGLHFAVCLYYAFACMLPAEMQQCYK
jgi:hypothetical protein